MSNTIKKSGNHVEIVFDGTTAVDFATDSTIDLPKGGYLWGLEFIPAAINGECTVRLNDATGIRIFYDKSVDGRPGGRPYAGSGAVNLYVKGNEMAASSTLLVEISSTPLATPRHG